MIDLLVAGGGPAGLAAAMHAARAGMQVVVVEPRPGPVDKACGEGLMPPAVDALEQLGVVLPRSHRFAGIRYLQGRWQAEARFRGGPGLGVRRTVLHAALAERARALGVRTVEGRVAEIDQDADRVRAGGHEARWLIVADGLRSRLREQLELSLPARRRERLGLRRHFAVEPWSDMVEVHWSPVAEAYVTPVDDQLVGVAMLWFKDHPPQGELQEGPFERLLDGFPTLRARLAGAPVASAVRGAGPFAQRVARRRTGRVLLVGDAAGYLDPLTGEGIRLGLASAEAAVGAILAQRPGDYEAAWQRLTRRYRWSTSALLAAAGNRLTRPLVVPAAARVPGLMQAAVGLLAA